MHLLDVNDGNSLLIYLVPACHVHIEECGASRSITAFRCVPAHCHSAWAVVLEPPTLSLGGRYSYRMYYGMHANTAMQLYVEVGECI